MSDTRNLEKAVGDLIFDLCGVLYQHGYQEISVGSLMRVIGVAPESAAKHDSEIIDLTQHFSRKTNLPSNQEIPPGVTWH
jgi:hypothetical protein